MSWGCSVLELKIWLHWKIHGLETSHITQGSPSDVRQMSGSDVEYIFLISSGQPDIRFGCPTDAIPGFELGSPASQSNLIPLCQSPDMLCIIFEQYNRIVVKHLSFFDNKSHTGFLRSQDDVELSMIY
ncbi:hypothetical protein OUZ56_017716 [Daphnia magna]|uniref:Uncharacterized protein n=1 Tax=Daphnia magna TaxID=35525 RepID=A0ABR0AU11_9CRUS|nr:hypothetical protein OUZ56_017716 [Daphnia magna]